MKEHLLRGVLLVVGIGVALAVAELMAIGWLYLEEGRYTSAADLFERTQNTYVHEMTKGTDCRFIDTLYPHPYVAFVHHANPPCGVSWVNNVGLFGPDFPVVKPTGRYVVILTGGSVASFLGGNQNAPRPNYLEEELNNNYISPTGQPWRVVDAAAGAWKEPQGCIIFALYATAVDAVVDLSGFNEQYYFAPGNVERLEGPASNFLEANPFVADDSFGDAAIGWVMGRIAGVLAANPVLRRSHTAYVAIRAIESAARGRDVFEGEKATIYSDQIHYASDNDGVSPGNRKVAARMAELLAESWGLKHKRKSFPPQAAARGGGLGFFVFNVWRYPAGDRPVARRRRASPR